MSVENEGINSPHNACCYRDSCKRLQIEIDALRNANEQLSELYEVEIDKRAEKIAELKKIIQNTISQAFYEDDFHRVHAINKQLQFENDAFRKELFNIGSMRSCSRAAELHGFVSPRQAGDDAREYIQEVLDKAMEKSK